MPKVAVAKPAGAKPAGAKRPSLARAERAQLTQLEDVISTAQRWRMEAAKALVVIRDKRLYRAEFPSFEKYAQERWGYERAYVYHLCQWGETVANLSTIGGALPERESHARPLYSLSPADQQRVWKQVVAKTSTPTARDVEQVARRYRSPVTREHTGALVYYGGKAALAPRITAELPPHHCFVESHAGGAAVTLAKAPSRVEVLNDIDDGLVNFYRVLREHRDELVRRLKLTPYARTEWDECRRTCDEPSLAPVERARRYYVAQCQSYSGTVTSFSRSNNRPSASYFADRVDRLDEVAERLRRVVVESMDAVELIRRYDDPNTCFYVDPPYLPETRTGHANRPMGKYRCEMTREQHVELLDALNSVKGRVLLSGYESPLYRKELRSWRVCWRHRVQCVSGTTVNRRDAHHRVEVLWANW